MKEFIILCDNHTGVGINSVFRPTSMVLDIANVSSHNEKLFNGL